MRAKERADDDGGGGLEALSSPSSLSTSLSCASGGDDNDGIVRVPSSSHGGHCRSEEEGEEEERVARWFADFPNQASSSFDNRDYDRDNNDNDHEGRHYHRHHYGDGRINGHWHSLRQMVAAGMGLGVLPGEWYGPTKACRVLSELNGVHCRERMGLYAKAGMIGKRERRRREGEGEGGGGEVGRGLRE